MENNLIPKRKKAMSEIKKVYEKYGLMGAAVVIEPNGKENDYEDSSFNLTHYIFDKKPKSNQLKLVLEAVTALRNMVLMSLQESAKEN